MQEIIEALRERLDLYGELTELILNAASWLSIVLGLIISVTRSVNQRLRHNKQHPLHTHFRIIFGGWLVVALELQLAADIVATIISPTTEHLIELGAIALIRTFLNYFLSRELKEELDYSREPTGKKEKGVI